MLRRFNYTNRKRIGRDDVEIVVRQEGGSFSFDADLSLLTEYGFAKECSVFVEAYRQTIWKRFDFGKIGAIQAPDDRLLDRFGTPDGIHFRVKIADPSNRYKLVAEADGIPLRAPEGTTAPTESLLRIVPADLQSEVFRVSYDENGPLLEISKHAGEKSAIAKDPAFASLAYPAIFRDILVRILLIDEHDDLENGESWQTQWLKFALRLPGVVAPPQQDDEDEVRDWIDAAAAAFARQANVMTKFAKHWESQA